MIVELWALMVIVSLVLVTIGLVKPDQTAQAIIGFFFLFLLAMPLLTGNIEIETGTNVTSYFSYDENGSIAGATQNLDYSYVIWNDSVSHNIGFWMAVGASIGLFGVLFSLDKVQMKWNNWRGR